jgi:peptide/nickel transport system substrate-binding protein
MTLPPPISRAFPTLRVASTPENDLGNFDPVWNPDTVVRNAAALVCDILYGVDDKPAPQRQMVEAEEVSEDSRGRTLPQPWTSR